MAEVAFPSPGLFQSHHGGIGLDSPASKGFWDAPSDRSDAESVEDEHFDSVASAPGLDDPQTQEIQDKAISENPFDSKDSKILFDAIDRLQSCGVSQELAIPQVFHRLSSNRLGSSIADHGYHSSSLPGASQLGSHHYFRV